MAELVRTFFIIFIIFISFTLLSCSNVQTEHYDDGSIKSEIPFKNEKRNGIATWYHNNGKKQLEVNYIDDLMDGKLKRWYHNGVLQLEENYQKGVLNGEKKTWDYSGNPTLIANYVDGKLHGDYIVFYQHYEVPKIEGQFYNGNYHGTWNYYDVNGLIVGQGIFDNGKGIQKEISLKGHKTKITNYENNVKEGWEFTFDEKGDTLTKLFYSKGILQSQNLTSN